MAELRIMLLLFVAVILGMIVLYFVEKGGR